MYYALVNTANNIVENIIVLEEGAQWSPPQGFVVIPLTESYGMGDSWNGSTFVKAAPPVADELPSSDSQPISQGTQEL